MTRVAKSATAAKRKPKVASAKSKPKSKAAKDAQASLETYRSKRDFSITSEPSDSSAERGSRLIIQHHYATRDHYDLRLEVDGVLKSWAVTRGPSANPKDKRLAVRTEDHPLDYATFEGLIPKGQYGGGTVILWEYTHFTPLNGDAAAAINKGEIKFEAHGERMRGRWVLVRMKTKEKRENWLLIKERDEFVEPDDGLVARFPGSVSSGRIRADIESGGAAVWAKTHTPGTPAKKSKGQKAPAFIAPMLCGQEDQPPEGKNWLYEMKYDGYRLQLAVGVDGDKLYTRSGLDWTSKFMPVAEEARRLDCKSALIDGEAVVLDARGLSDFPALVNALDTGVANPIVFIAFDLLALDGKDQRALPLAKRKAKLAGLVGSREDSIRLAGHIEGEGAAVFAAAVAAGAEGIIAKDRTANYRSGRSNHWLKIKGYPRTDVIIIGYMPSTKGDLFASLLAAVEENGSLRYVGRIGTGYSAQVKTAVWPRLGGTGSVKPSAGLQGAELLPRKARYIRQPLRAEVRFGGWTGDRQMRQARFLALRDDLPLTSVAPAAPRAKASGMPSGASPIVITHPTRVVYHGDKITKGDIAAYYDAIAERMAAYLDQRPVSIVRAPESIEETFFQRHPLKGMTRGIVPVEIGSETYMAIDGAVGLRTAAQFGAIEFHGWMSRTDALDNPDRLIFDLDPDEALSFAEVKRAARDISAHLADLGIRTWPMISGGKGIHVIAPLDGTLAYGETEIFAKGFALGLEKQDGKRFVANMSKARRKGRIFVDWLRNKKSATAILPWSLRARTGATVAVPLTWDMLENVKSAAAFSINTAPTLHDPWDTFFTTQQAIPQAAIAFMRER